MIDIIYVYVLGIACIIMIIALIIAYSYICDLEDKIHDMREWLYYGKEKN